MKVEIREWNQDKLIAEISGRLVSGMDKACQFAVGAAEARAPVRTGRLRAAIDYEVVPVGNDVEGRVGWEKKGAFYGRFQELGTSKMAAHPHLRPAVFENGATIIRLIEEG